MPREAYAPPALSYAPHHPEAYPLLDRVFPQSDRYYTADGGLRPELRRRPKLETRAALCNQIKLTIANSHQL